MHISEQIRAKRETDFGLENALAGYVRRRWPDKAIPHVMHEWGLSESEAAKVVYANASKNTLRKLLHHKRGGADLFIGLVCDVCSTTLEQYITNKARGAEHERRSWEAEERRLKTMAARVSGDGVELGRGVEPAGGHWPEHAEMGARPAAV